MKNGMPDGRKMAFHVPIVVRVGGEQDRADEGDHAHLHPVLRVQQVSARMFN